MQKSLVFKRDDEEGSLNINYQSLVQSDKFKKKKSTKVGKNENNLRQDPMCA